MKRKEINEETLAQQLNDAQNEIMREYRLQQFGICIPEKKSTDGYYHVYIPDNTKKNKRRQIKAKTINDLLNKIDNALKNSCPSVTRSFKETFDIVENKKLNRVKDPDLKKSKEQTVNRDYTQYKRFFNDTSFEKKDVSMITKLDIENVIEMNLARYDLRPKALQSMQGIICSIFKYAYQNYWIPEDISKRIDYKDFYDGCISPTPIRDRCYTKDDINKLIDYAHQMQTLYPKKSNAYAYELQIYTGLRRGELSPLTWDDVIVQDNVVYLSITKQLKEDNSIVNRTKTNKDRVVPLTSNAREVLHKLEFLHREYYPNSKYLFPTNKALGCIVYSAVYGFHKIACRNLGIPISKDYIKGTHAFRRTIATEFRNKGVNPQAVSNYLGHNKMTEDLNYYVGGYDNEVAHMIANLG